MCSESKYYKSKLSKKNPSYIPDHRYHELRHFCLQCNDKNKDAEYRRQMIISAAEKLPEWIREPIMEGVTHGYSYDYLSMHMDVPCCRDVYYKNYRQFFYELSEISSLSTIVQNAQKQEMIFVNNEEKV